MNEIITELRSLSLSQQNALDQLKRIADALAVIAKILDRLG